MKLIKSSPYANVIKKEEYGRIKSRALVQTDNINKVIFSSTTYFNYTLTQRYSVAADETSYIFTMRYKSPKWFEKKIRDITILLKNKQHGFITNFIEINTKYLFSITSHWDFEHHATLEYKTKGLQFLSPREMISFREELVSLYKISMLGIKNTSFDEFAEKHLDYNLIKDSFITHSRDQGMYPYNIYIDLCSVM